MPDMSPEKELPYCNWEYYRDSIHEFLKKHMENEKKLLEEYLSVKEGAFKFKPYLFDGAPGS